MNAKPKFSSLLDDLFRTAEAQAGGLHRPVVDYLSVADELHSGRIKVSADVAAASYASAGTDDLEAELAELLEERSAAESSNWERLVSADAIAAELALAGRDAAGLARARREFALRNHPDRAPPQLRAVAERRMQIANMLIDDAERRWAKVG